CRSLSLTVRERFGIERIVDCDSLIACGHGLREVAASLKQGRYGGDECHRKALTQTLVVREKEGLVLDDRTTNVGAKLVAFERRVRQSRGIVEPVVGFYIGVTFKIIDEAVVLIGAGFRDDINYATRSPAEFGVVA